MDPGQPEDLEKYYAYYRTVIQNYTMMSDTFMRNMLKDKDCAEFLLRVIMEKPDLKIQSVTVQRDYKNLQGKSSVLDCVAQDSSGSLYDIEVEQSENGADPRRARYYSGLLDMNHLRQGQDYSLLKKSFVIFIEETDRIGAGLPVYHIRRIIQETGGLYHDGTCIIHVNAGLEENTDLGRLVHDFHCSNPADMYCEILRKRANTLKNSPEEVSCMCREMYLIEQRGREEGRMESQRQNVIRMHARGYDVETIADLLDISCEQVEAWLREAPVSA